MSFLILYLYHVYLIATILVRDFNLFCLNCKWQSLGWSKTCCHDNLLLGNLCVYVRACVHVCVRVCACACVRARVRE